MNLIFNIGEGVNESTNRLRIHEVNIVFNVSDFAISVLKIQPKLTVYRNILEETITEKMPKESIFVNFFLNFLINFYFCLEFYLIELCYCCIAQFN